MTKSPKRHGNYLVSSKKGWRFFHIFVAFSEYIHFIGKNTISERISLHSLYPKPPFLSSWLLKLKNGFRGFNFLSCPSVTKCTSFFFSPIVDRIFLSKSCLWAFLYRPFEIYLELVIVKELYHWIWNYFDQELVLDQNCQFW